MMMLMENMISSVAMDVLGTTKINYQGKELDLTPPWDRKTMLGAIKEYTGIDFNELLTVEEAGAEAKKMGIEVEESDTWGKILDKIFEEKVEPKLIQPVHILRLSKGYIASSKGAQR